MSKTATEYRRYISHAVSGGKEYFMFSVVKHEEEYNNSYHFKIAGVGVASDVTAETLKDVEEEIEKSIQVSQGRFQEDNIDKDTPMTSAHHDKVVDFIEEEIDKYAESMTALEWLKENN